MGKGRGGGWGGERWERCERNLDQSNGSRSTRHAGSMRSPECDTKSSSIPMYKKQTRPKRDRRKTEDGWDRGRIVLSMVVCGECGSYSGRVGGRLCSLGKMGRNGQRQKEAVMNKKMANGLGKKAYMTTIPSPPTKHLDLAPCKRPSGFEPVGHT